MDRSKTGVCFQYDEEYVPDMAWRWGSGDTLSRERWHTLRKKALLLISCEYYGDLASCSNDDSRLTQAMREEKRSTGGH
eukprot:4837543-Pleurochrysis_carterae.AAC.1